MPFHLARSSAPVAVVAPVVFPQSVSAIIGYRNNSLPAYQYTERPGLNIRITIDEENHKPVRFFYDARDWLDKDTPQSVKSLLNLYDEIVIQSGGEPAFIKGGGYIPEGSIIISEDFREMMSFPDVRRRNDEIVFPTGKRWKRDDCWTLTSVIFANKIITKYRIKTLLPAQITRDTICAVCLEDLSGSLVACINDHQIHRYCYEGIVSSGRTVCCPTCRAMVMKPEDKEIVSTTLWFNSARCGNSTQEHRARSWSFLSWLRHLENIGRIYSIEEKFMLHSLHHYYFHKYEGTATSRLTNWDGSPVIEIDEENPDGENAFSDFIDWYCSDEHFKHIMKTEHPFNETPIDNGEMIRILKSLYDAEATLNIMASMPSHADEVRRFKRWVWLQRFKPTMIKRNACMLLNILLKHATHYAQPPFSTNWFVSEMEAIE